MEAFIDSNVILKYLEGNKIAENMLDKIDIGFINPIIVSETFTVTSGLRQI